MARNNPFDTYLSDPVPPPHTSHPTSAASQNQYYNQQAVKGYTMDNNSALVGVGPAHSSTYPGLSNINGIGRVSSPAPAPTPTSKSSGSSASSSSRNSQPTYNLGMPSMTMSASELDSPGPPGLGMSTSMARMLGVSPATFTPPAGGLQLHVPSFLLQGGSDVFSPGFGFGVGSSAGMGMGGGSGLTPGSLMGSMTGMGGMAPFDMPTVGSKGWDDLGVAQPKYFTPEEKTTSLPVTQQASRRRSALPFDFAEPTVKPAPSPAHSHGSYQEAASVVEEMSPEVPALEQAPSTLALVRTSPQTQPQPRTITPLYAPNPAGLPVYSQSGFDMLAILGRVANRAHPCITLGPVDLTCAFVVTDMRAPDMPIVYASRTFCELTGYSEGEVLGRNCRFLQAPDGRVSRGEARRYTSPEAAKELKFAVAADREVQISMINYRKDGRPFVNRVSVVPVPAGDSSGEIAFHVGFQVDLNEQPSLIVQRLREGKYYSGGTGGGRVGAFSPAERSVKSMGQELRRMLTDPIFQSKLTLTTASNAQSSAAAAVAALAASSSPASANTTNFTPSPKPDTRDERQWAHLLLLEQAPDFVHVLSLKGHFLYAAPSVRRALGYEPAELAGRSIADVCHPADAVPLLRELKESSALPGLNPVYGAPGEESGASPVVETRSQVQNQTQGQGQGQGPRTVDLLFRMRTKAGTYVWVECLGRLHVEPGKGRKAIVLSGRVCAVPSLPWGAVSRGGGLLAPVLIPSSSSLGKRKADPSEDTEGELGEDDEEERRVEREFWAMLCADGIFLVASAGVRDVLEWGTGEMIGRSIREFVISGSSGSGESFGDVASAQQVREALKRVSSRIMVENGTLGGEGIERLTCLMKKRDGGCVWMQVVLYRSSEDTSANPSANCIVAQFKSLPLSGPSPTSLSPSLFSPVSYPSVSSYSPGSSFGFGLGVPPGSAVPFSRPAVGRILHTPDANVFEALEAKRGSSWQYELQQLKFANRKLRDEVEALEAGVRGGVGTGASAGGAKRPRTGEVDA